MRGRGRTQSFSQTIAKPVTKEPESNPWFWNPARVGVRSAPGWFQEQLEQIDPDLRITWNAHRERWQVWARVERLRHPLARGWRLLFIHHDVDGSYLPLDERLFARVYAASARANGDARQYFDRIVSEMDRDKAKREADYRQETADIAGEVYDHTRISTAGKGNKFAEYHQ